MQKQYVSSGLVHRQPTLFMSLFLGILWVGLVLITPFTAQAQPCTPPMVSLVNTGPGNCVGVASLSVGSNQPISRLDWFKGGSLVFTAFPQSTTEGTTVAGGNGLGTADNNLNYPQGVYVDGSGAIYVVDYSNHRVQKFPPNSTSATAGTTVAGGNGAGSAANQLNQPYGIYVDGSGAVYVVDRVNARIQKWAAGASSGTTVAGGNGVGSAANQLNHAFGVYVDGSGAVYVADGNNARIQKWAVGATSGTTVAGGNGIGPAANQMNGPVGVYVDGSGAIYVAEVQNNRIQKWAVGATSGTTVAGTGISGSAANELSFPYGVYGDGSGVIYVTDRGNHRIQKFPPNSTSATNGTTVAGGNGDGSAANQLSSPYSAYVDGSRAVYVADYANHRVQKWFAGGDSPVYSPTAGGSYTVLVTSADGCTATTDVLTITEPPSVSISPASQTITSGGSVTLTASGAESYNWSDGSTDNPLIISNVTSDTAFSVTGTTSGCSGTATATVSVTAASCVSPTVSLVNTGPGNCVGVASLSVGSNQTISQLDWFNGSSLVFTSTYQSTTAGTTVAGITGSSGSAANQLNGPNTVYVDGSGAIYVCDQSNHRIQKWAAGGAGLPATSGTTVAGGNGQGSGANQLDYPRGVYVDGSGAIYVSDANNTRIQKFPPNSTSATNVITVAGGNGFGNGANQLSNTANVYVDGSGAVYIADGFNNRIQKWAAGAISGTTVAGGNGAGSGANQLDNPTGLYVDGSGAVYVAEWNNHRIQKFPPNSTSSTPGTTVAGGNGAGSGVDQLNNPFGVYVDGSGAIYITDKGNDRIQKWAAGGSGLPATSGTTVAGGNGGGSGANQLYFPFGVYVDGSGAVYVADVLNHRVQKWAASGVSPVYNPTAGGSYTVLVTSADGCTATTNVLTITEPPSVSISPALQTITSGGSVTLTASGGTTYLWSDGSTANPLVVSNVTSATAFSVTGTTGGCSGTATVGITVLSALVITDSSPARNVRNAPASANVALGFDQPLNTGPASLTTLRVFSQQRGGLLRHNQGGSTNVSSNTLTFAPTTPFRPGETVLTSVLNTLQSTTGSSLVRGQVHQFTVQTGGTGRGNFIPHPTNSNPTVSNGPESVALGDVDGDGDLDFIAINKNNSTISVRLNNGSGSFTGSTSISVGSTPVDVALGDVDGDGDLDFIAARQSSNSVSVWLNDGSGNFTAHATNPNPAVGSTPIDVALGDVDGDGDLDFIAANYLSSNVSVRLNDGSGNFTGSTNISVGTNPRGVALGDLDADGDLDFIVSNLGNSNVSVRLNDGSGNFTGSTNISVGSAPVGVALGDVDGDGDLDFIAANLSSSTVSVRLNDGSGNFTAPATNPNPAVGTTPRGVALGDVDADGDLDFIVANQSSNNVSVRLNNGSGNFTAPVTNPNPAVGSTPVDVALGDVDGDGDLDFIAPNAGSGTVSVRLNQALAPTIAGFAASSGSLCTGQVASFTATVGNVTGTYTFTLTNGSNPVSGTASTTAFSQTVVASGSGLQTFTLTVAQNGASATATTGLTPINVSLTSGTLTCANTSITLTASTTGGLSYTFSSGATPIGATNQATVNAPGIYSVVVTNVNGCTASATAEVFSQITALTVSLINTGPGSCAGVASLSVSSNQTINRLDWFNGSSLVYSNTGVISPVYSPTAGGSHTVLVTSANGCTATSNAVAVTPSPSSPIAATISAGNTLAGEPTVFSTNSLTICQGQPVSMTVAGCPMETPAPVTGPNSMSGAGTGFVFVGTGFTGFPQTPGAPIAQITDGNLQLGIYTFSVWCVNLLGCQSTGSYPFTLVVTTAPLAVVFAGFNPTCPNEGAVQGTLSCPTGTLQYGYAQTTNGFYTNFTNPNVTFPTTAGVYSLTARCTNGGSCLGPLGFVAVRNRIQPAAPLTQQASQYQLCLGQRATLTAGCSFSTVWYVAGTNELASGTAIGTNSLLISPLEAGIYNYQPACIDPAFNCPSDRDNTPVSLTVLPPTTPIRTLSTQPNPTIAGQPVVLQAEGCVGTTIFYVQGSNTELGRGTGNVVSLTVHPQSVTTYDAICTNGLCPSNRTTGETVYITSCSFLANVIPASSWICPGANPITLTASGGVRYLWSNGETTQRIQTAVPGAYSVIVTSAQGCTASGSATITAGVVPLAAIRGNAVLIAGQPISLTATGGGLYVWNGPAMVEVGGEIQLISQPGTYTVRVISPTGCTASASITLTDTPAPTAPIIAPGTNLSACVGDRVLLTATCPIGTPRFKRGQVSTDAATEVVIAGEPSAVIYQVTCFVNAVESAPTTAQVVFRAIPASVQILQTGQLCTDGPDSITLSAAVGAGPPGSRYSWSTGETTQRILVNTVGLYSVNVFNEAGCVATASQMVTGKPCGVATAIQVLTATMTCTNGQIQITASGGNGNLIQYSIGGVQYATNNVLMLDPAIQSNAANVYVQLFVRQVNSSGTGFDVVGPFQFNFRAACPVVSQTVVSPSPPATPPNTTACGSPASTIGQSLEISGVSDINCVNGTFRILTTGGNGQPINFAGIVGLSNTDPYNCMRTLDTPELIRQVNNPTSMVAPFQLRGLNVGGSTSPVFVFNLKQVCTGVARVGLSTEANSLDVTVLGNPTLSESVEIEVVGAIGQPLWLRLVDGLGTVISEHRVEQAGAIERQRLSLSRSAGVYLLRVSTPGQSKTVKVVRQ